MRIVVGSLQHETNTLSPVKTTFEDFDYAQGERVFEKIAVTRLFHEAGVEMIPAIYANAVPSGKLEKKSFVRFRDEILEAIPSDGSIDGIWLYLHGAMEAEEVGSGEVALLTEIRRKVGNSVPIAVALDFHANNSEKLAELANIICGYRTAPHTDMKETQIRAGELLLHCIREKLLPRPVLVRIPLMLTGDMVITANEPVRSVLQEALNIEKRGEVLSVSVFNGQPWVDAPNTGASIVVVPGRDRKAAEEAAAHLARLYWNARKDFRFAVEALEPEAAAEAALRAEEPFVLVTDSGDNTTAGASGDNTHLLKVFLSKKAERTLVAGITDSKAVKGCFGHETGTPVKLTLGAEMDAEKSEQAEIDGVLKGKGNVLGWDGEDAGRAVILGVQGVDVIVTERRCAFISPEIFRSIGVDMFDYKIVAVKLGYLYPELEKVSKRTILALTPGASCEDIPKIAFKNIARPVYPVDPHFEWQP